MLYKKIHRQHFREFKVGRKFRFYGNVYKITEEPNIKGNCICVDIYNLMFMTGPHKGVFRGNHIEWLD